MGKFSLEIDHTANPIPDTTQENFFKQLSIFIIKQQKINDELSAIAEKVRLDPKANRYPNIVNRKTQLSAECDKNQRLINTEIKKINANNKFENELRRLPQRHLQLLDKQKKLAQELCEEKINEEQAERLKAEINNELFWLCSEPVSRLYKSDFQNILTNGISKANLSYLGKLSQLDERIRNTAEDKIADYHMETAEKQIAKNSQKASQRVSGLIKKNSVNNPCDFEIAFDENESLPALFTVDSVDRIYELVLNGADPSQESEGLGQTPLDRLFSTRYEIQQSLNGIYIAKSSVQAARQMHSSKELKVELKNQKKHLKIAAAALKLELKNNETHIKAQIEVLVLRNPDAEVSHYPDIARSEKYLSIWNACKQEVVAMKQSKLTETCCVYDLFIENIEKLPDIPANTLKSLGAKFPHYYPLLKMQNDIIVNYRLVLPKSQQVIPTTEGSLVGTSDNVTINRKTKILGETMPNDNLNKKNPDFVAELKGIKGIIEKQTQEQPIDSSSLIYADLEFSGIFGNNPIENKDNTDKTEYTQILSLGLINQAKKIIADINTENKKIQGIENSKKLNQPASNLAIIKEEVKKARENKLILETKLSEIRGPLNSEFNVNFERLQNKETELEKDIKDTHGHIDKYYQLTSDLFNTRNEHIGLIQNNIEFEKILANHSKDLQDEAGTPLYHLYKDELSLQTKRLATLEEKKELIKLNSHLHDQENNEKQSSESSADIDSCYRRILLLKNEIDIKEKTFQNEEIERITIGSLAPDGACESSEYAINSFYGQEEQQTSANILPIDPIAKPKPLSESEQLKKQMEALTIQRIETINQLRNEELSSKKSIFSSELDGIELSIKAKYDRIAELEKEKLAAPVVDSNKSKPVESTQTEKQGAVPKKKPDSVKPAINLVAKLQERSEQIIKDWQKPLSEPVSEPTQQKLEELKKQKELEDLLKAKPKKTNLLENSTNKQSAVSAKNKNPAFFNELNEKLQAKQAMQGTSTSTFFGSGNSSISGDKTKTPKIPTRKQLSQ